MNTFSYIVGLGSTTDVVGQLFDMAYSQHTVGYNEPPSTALVFVPSPRIVNTSGINKTFKCDVTMEIETTENKDQGVEFMCTIDDNNTYNTLTPVGIIDQSRVRFFFNNVPKTVSWSFITPIASGSGLYFRAANLTKADMDLTVRRFKVSVSQV